MIKNLIITFVIFALSVAIGYAVTPASSAIAGLPSLVSLAIVIFVIQWVAFIPAFLLQTEKFYDLIGSLTYLTSISLAVIYTEALDLRSLLIAAFVGIWALRLGSFLIIRISQDGGDGRFDKIKPSFHRFLLTWSIQGLWVFLTAICALTAIANSGQTPLTIIDYVGITVWVIGFAVEAISDKQKRTFRANPNKTTSFITTGLWAYSRHPNYVGEIVLWVGIAIMALPTLNGLQYIALISPVFVYLLLTRVSGVPLLENGADEKWGGEEAYEEYKKNTPVLFPKLSK